jgi:hypothetical protein
MRLDQRVLAQLTGALVCLAVRRNNYDWALCSTQSLRTASAHTSATPITTPNILREPKRWTIRSHAWLDFVIELQTHDTSSESRSGFAKTDYAFHQSICSDFPLEAIQTLLFRTSSSTSGSGTITTADHSHLLPHEPKHIASSQLAVRFCF